jgi:hypothetical protein
MPRGNKRNGAKRAAKNNADGTYEVRQSVVMLRPTYGPTCPISRTIRYNWAIAAADQGFTVDWALSDVANSTEFTNLFKQWCLKGARLSVNWRSSNEANPIRPVVYYGMDPFTTGTITQAIALERPHKTWTPNAQRTLLQIACKPRVVMLTSTTPAVGATIVNSLAPVDSWYDTTQPSLGYGALWFYIANWNTTAANGGAFELQQDYDFHFRGTQ